jgi:hypothetical protein
VKSTSSSSKILKDLSGSTHIPCVDVTVEKICLQLFPPVETVSLDWTKHFGYFIFRYSFFLDCNRPLVVAK